MPSCCSIGLLSHPCPEKHVLEKNFNDHDSLKNGCVKDVWTAWIIRMETRRYAWNDTDWTRLDHHSAISKARITEKSSDVDVDVESPIKDRRTELGGGVKLYVTKSAMVRNDIVDQKILGRAGAQLSAMVVACLEHSNVFTVHSLIVNSLPSVN
ncbi:hypothetical protein KIN20_035763 [Parelaphostrongylus tenuis]|uniref:Uncharacterized protein n=1 Tax=Parelaphostrongylus tenuis TaxID=148309 RepID=A0AAD5RC97_PARTN|nr:hypothetical protein KIN20_035763 [Parelaphostrongylus tenuis]